MSKRFVDRFSLELKDSSLPLIIHHAILQDSNEL